MWAFWSNQQQWAHWGFAVNHLQPPQSLYQNEDDNPSINFCNYIEVRFKVYWPESGLKVSESKISKFNSWSFVWFRCNLTLWKGSWEREEQNPYNFRSQRGRNRRRKPGLAAAYPGLFSTLCCTVCGMNRAKIPPRGARRGGYESNWGGRRKKMGPGRVFLKQATFTDEYFVGKGYSWLKKIYWWFDKNVLNFNGS